MEQPKNRKLGVHVYPGKSGQTGNSGRMFYNEFNIQVHLKNHVFRGVVNSKSKMFRIYFVSI